MFLFYIFVFILFVFNDLELMIPFIFISYKQITINMVKFFIFQWYFCILSNNLLIIQIFIYLLLNLLILLVLFIYVFKVIIFSRSIQQTPILSVINVRNILKRVIQKVNTLIILHIIANKELILTFHLIVFALIK
jgi:hypothetical protein